jgi:hypothetical protein
MSVIKPNHQVEACALFQLDAWILPVKSASYIKNDLGHHWVCTNRAAVVKGMPLQNIEISTQDLLGS